MRYAVCAVDVACGPCIVKGEEGRSAAGFGNEECGLLVKRHIVSGEAEGAEQFAGRLDLCHVEFACMASGVMPSLALTITKPRPAKFGVLVCQMADIDPKDGHAPSAPSPLELGQSRGPAPQAYTLRCAVPRFSLEPDREAA